MNLPRIGMVGVGRFGQNHSRILADSRHCDYIGLYDIDQPRADEISNRDGTRSFSSLEELLDAVDAVVIAVSSANHFEVTSSCLENSKHVLLEKPLTTEVKQAEKLISLANKYNSGLFTGHLERFNPAISTALATVTNPSTIHIERHGTWVPRRVTADVVYDLMIHDLDILSQLGVIAFHNLSVTALKMANTSIDTCDVHFVAQNGLQGFLSASRTSHHRSRSLRISNSRQTVVSDMIQQTCLYCDHSSGAGSFKPINVDPVKPLDAEIESFISFVSGKDAVLPATGSDGLQAMKLANSILDAV